jgi:hypothetical protein
MVHPNYSLGHRVPQTSIGFGLHFSRIGNSGSAIVDLHSSSIATKYNINEMLVLFKMAGTFVEWAKCFKQFRENFERIVPVFYGFCIVSNSGHSC